MLFSPYKTTLLLEIFQNQYYILILYYYLEQIKTKSGIWFLDVRDNHNHPYPLKGWFSPQGLKDLFDKKTEEENKRLVQSDYDYLQDKNGLGLRDYQIDAIKAVETKIIKAVIHKDVPEI